MTVVCALPSLVLIVVRIALAVRVGSKRTVGAIGLDGPLACGETTVNALGLTVDWAVKFVILQNIKHKTYTV